MSYKIDAVKDNEHIGRHYGKSPAEIYEMICDEAPDDILLRVDEILNKCEGEKNAISKEQLSVAIFGKFTETTDRQNRDAIADLVTFLKRRYVSSSSKKGYFKATTIPEIEMGIKDMAKRLETGQARLNSLQEIRSEMAKGIYQTSFLTGVGA